MKTLKEAFSFYVLFRQDIVEFSPQVRWNASKTNIFYWWLVSKIRRLAYSKLSEMKSIDDIKFTSVKFAVSSSWLGFVQALVVTLLIQFLTGIPKPSYLKELDSNQVLLRVSEEIFDYPFWLQDLSHLPIFFVFAWFWLRYLGPLSGSFLKARNTIIIAVCFGYAVINELSQFFIPQRFPSVGDLIMNVAGVALAFYSHKKICDYLSRNGGLKFRP